MRVVLPLSGRLTTSRLSDASRPVPLSDPAIRTPTAFPPSGSRPCFSHTRDDPICARALRALMRFCQMRRAARLVMDMRCAALLVMRSLLVGVVTPREALVWDDDDGAKVGGGERETDSQPTLLLFSFLDRVLISRAVQAPEDAFAMVVERKPMQMASPAPEAASFREMAKVMYGSLSTCFVCRSQVHTHGTPSAHGYDEPAHRWRLSFDGVLSWEGTCAALLLIYPLHRADAVDRMRLFLPVAVHFLHRAGRLWLARHETAMTEMGAEAGGKDE
ncbi:hypothetical protein C8J57DRAFT_1564658 [Mycena rebaudengoi]|nr:hypothetical protein C8J57DRAFT_1564658 [Mycena rebaudengoi]